MSGSDAAWPFAGRIIHALGDELLDRKWLCLRTAAGPAFIPLTDPAARALFEHAPAIQPALDLIASYRVRGAALPAEPPAPGGILGVDTPSRLTTRPGILLSDYLLMKTSVARDLHDAQALEARLGADWLTHLMQVLFSELYRSEITLSGLRWPFTPTPAAQSITAEMLPSWQIDLATDFARLVGTETYLCDLRVEQRLGQLTPGIPSVDDLQTLSDPEARIAILLAIWNTMPEATEAKPVRRVAVKHYGKTLDHRPKVLGLSDRQLRRIWPEVKRRRKKST
jgi:hypothetical protein